MCQCFLFLFFMIFNNDPIQHILFFFFFFVVLNCITIQLELLLWWHGHCLNSFCTNRKLIKTYLKDRYEQLTWNQCFENAQNNCCILCSDVYWSQWKNINIIIGSCIDFLLNTLLLNLAFIWLMCPKRWYVADATANCKLMLSGAFSFFTSTSILSIDCKLVNGEDQTWYNTYFWQVLCYVSLDNAGIPFSLWINV